MGAEVSSSLVVSATPSSSGEGLLTFFPCSSLRSFSWETFLHKFLQRESFPWVEVVHKLPQSGSLPWGAVLQEQAAPARFPNGITSQQTCSSMGSSLHGSTGPARNLLQRGLPTGSQPLLGIHLPQCGIASRGYRWISSPSWTSMDCRRTACLTVVFITSCKERLSAPAS